MKYIIVTLLGLFCFCHETKANVSVWDGHSYSTSWYTNGYGSDYHIKSASDLAGLSYCFSQGYYLYDNFQGKTIILDTDIDLNNYEWTPIGTIDSRNISCTFEGVFDGNGHTIKGLSITTPNNNLYIKYAGLFGYSSSNSFTVKNLKVEGEIQIDNVSLQSGCSFDIGGVVGTASGTIENCQSDVDIDVSVLSGEFSKINCGGVAGAIYENGAGENCRNCYSKGEIKVRTVNSCDVQTGGIVGNLNNSNATISCVASDMNISVYNGRMSFIGGLFGQATCKTVENALFTGEITAYYSNHGLVGGIVGGGPQEISKSIVVGKLEKISATAYISAISGVSSSELIVNDCYYLSSMTSTNSYGTPITESVLKSGEHLNNFDADIWLFAAGEFPSLQFLSANYIISIPTENGSIGFCVKEGHSATIQLDAESGWQLRTFYVDGSDYTSYVSNGKYIFQQVDSNHSINVVFERIYDQVRNAKTQDNPSIAIKEGRIVIGDISENTIIDIYDLTGKKIQSYIVNSPISFTLKSGIYIIHINNNSYKISV